MNLSRTTLLRVFCVTCFRFRSSDALVEYKAGSYTFGFSSGVFTKGTGSLMIVPEVVLAIPNGSPPSGISLSGN